MKINHRLVRVVAVLGMFAAAPLALAAPAHAATDLPPGPGATDYPPGPGATALSIEAGATDVPPGPNATDWPPGPSVAFASGSSIIAI